MKRKKIIALLLTLALLLSAVPNTAAYGLDMPVGDAGYGRQAEPDMTDPTGGDPNAADPAEDEPDVVDPDGADPAEDEPDGDNPDGADPTGDDPGGTEPSYDGSEDINAPDPAYDGWDDPQDEDPVADAPEKDVPITAVYNVPEAVEVFAASGSWQPKPNKTATGSSAFPLKLSDGNVLQINGPVDFTAPTGQSAIQIDSGATVAIIINGSVTLRGADAKGTIGATAAINVPENAKLTIYSAHDEELSTSKDAPKDTLTVTGGNAAAGADGTMGEKKEIKQENIQQVTTAWMAGSGGNGGGGAAAAIGGNGGSGGVGGAGGIDYQKDQYIVERAWTPREFYNVDDHKGTSGKDGTAGSSGGGAGIIYISGRLTLNASGGSAAAGGSGGSGCGGYANTTNNDHMIGGCGGGGGGGGGCSAPAIGAGGAGGSGGGSGGHPGSDVKGNVQGPGGGGGGGGWPNGGGGGGGGAECTKAENKNDNKSQGGSGGSGGGVNGSGSNGSSGTSTGTKGHGYDNNRYDAEPGSGGAGASGVQGAGGSGGAGGTEKDRGTTDRHDGGPGGAGGKAVPLKAWHSSANLILSTAANINGYSWGDGGGNGTAVGFTPRVVYDLMDCQITLTPSSYIYTGKQLRPTVQSVRYSSASDRDSKNITNINKTLSGNGYSISGYGENIHCPSGTVTVLGAQNGSRTTVQTNEAVIGSAEVTFTIHKATLAAPITMNPTKPYLNQSATASLSTYTSTTAGSGQLAAVWRGSTKKAEGPKVTWSVQNSAGTVTEANGLQAKVSLTNTSATVTAKLTDMNDFNDYMATLTVTTQPLKPWTSTLSADTPHPRVPISVKLINGITNPTYQWYANGTAISGAAAQSYTPTAADIGKTLSVKVTPNAASGYAAATVAAKNAVEAHKYSGNGFCTVCNEYQPATKSSGTYQITNGGQLFWFAALVNGDGAHAVFAAKDAAASAVLTKDIDLEGREWTSIGGDGNNYTGTFRGQNHTISKMSITKAASYTGLFGRTTGTICDFTVEGSITLPSAELVRIGGAVGTAYGGTVSGICSKVSIDDGGNACKHIGGVVGGVDTPETAIERCVFEGTIHADATTDCIGGILGYSNGGARIRWCANRGAVTAKNNGAYTGGILGYVNNSGPSVRNCYNYGTVKNGDGNYCGAIVGRMRANTGANYTDNYYLDSSAPAGIGKGSNSTTAKVYAKDKKAFANGEVCYLVNGSVSDETVVWRQDIDNDNEPYDSYPVFDGGIVMCNGNHDCTAGRMEITYSNTAQGEMAHINHNYVNGFCACCDVLQPAEATGGVYQITNGGQFFWFAQQINAGAILQNTAAALSADIDLEGSADGQPAGYEGITKARNFPCVGITDELYNYKGTFSGNGHTVSDLYISRINVQVKDVGLFGKVNGASISEMTVKGKIVVQAAADKGIQHVGGMVGAAYNSKLSQLFSYVNITGIGGIETPHVGGVAGEATNGAEVFQCMYFGTIDLESTQDCVGGVVAYINDATVRYCANHGSVKTGAVNAFAGGVVGYLNNNGGKVVNCYNYGSVQNGGGNNCGGVIGCLRNHNAANIADNYYLKGSAPFGIFVGTKYTNDVEAPARSNAAFVSGEVCYLVNSKTSTGDKALWKQDIDNGNTPYDSYPVFDAAAVYLHSDGVYSNEPESVSVTIAWGDMTFNYNAGSWDPEKHTYSGGWSPVTTESNGLSVENNSNVALLATITFKAADAFTQYGLTGTFNGIAADANRIERDGVLAAKLNLKSQSPETLKNGSTKKIGEITISLTTVGGGN